jgi:very-short-patch-repair endonuclease
MSVTGARVLRRTMTDAERKLWLSLRGRQLDGAKFRRQHPLGRYVLDFYCEESRLVVGVDGGHHTPERDAVRTEWLEAHGCRVIRFGNLEVLQQLPAVLEAISLALAASPHPRAGARLPLPMGEGKSAS